MQWRFDHVHWSKVALPKNILKRTHPGVNCQGKWFWDVLGRTFQTSVKILCCPGQSGHLAGIRWTQITVIAIAFRPAKRDERFRWTGWTYENLETHRIQPTSRVKRHVEAWFVAQRHFRNVSHLISCRALYEFVACCIPAAIGVLNNRIYIIGLSGKCSWKRCFHLFSWPNFATVHMGLSEQ